MKLHTFIRNISCAILLLVMISLSCSDDSAQSHSWDDRPYQPWVFRSVLDQNARIITLALDKDIWVSYYTQTGGMYKAWKGEVLFDGPVYTNNHGPQPISIGPAYVQNELTPVWSLHIGGQAVPTSYQYRGHKIVDGQAILMYELTSDRTDAIVRVEERIESDRSELGDIILDHQYSISGLPADMQLTSYVHEQSIVTTSNIVTSTEIINDSISTVTKGNRNLIDYYGSLRFAVDGQYDYQVSYVGGAAIPNPHSLGDEEDTEGTPEGARLIARNDCKTCHNKNVKTIGPAYVSVAKKYKNTEDNINMLMSKVRNGGSGVWGSQIMNAHPDLDDYDLRKMISYIMSLDADTETHEPSSSGDGITTAMSPSSTINEDLLIPGSVTQVIPIRKGINRLNDIKNQKPIMAGIMKSFDNISGADFAELEDDFMIRSEGYLHIPKSDSYSFRVWSDDGSRITLNDTIILDNDGLHGTEYKETSLYLEEGYHPFLLEFFQGAGGKFLSFNWKPNGAEAWMVIPPSAYYHTKDMQEVIGDLTLPMANINLVPGDRTKLEAVHPAFTLSQARPEAFAPRVGGLDFLSDGRIVVSTWDAEGGVYIVDHRNAATPNDIGVTKIASGLAEPLGLRVVDDEIYVMQKQELTHLVDHDGDELIDEYRTLCDDWEVSANFHEFGFGLAYLDGYFYATLATAIEPGGASTQPQIQDRGKCIKVSIEDGSLEFVASGLRTPNGVGVGYHNDIYIADNQGDWLPASKILHVEEGAFFGSRSVDYEGTEGIPEKPPVVWLPQDEIGNSPSTPISINVGPYQDQMIHGEVTNGGIKRVYVEEIEGQLQGSLFRFIQGLEAGVNRIEWGPDGALYAGGIGSTGNWGQDGKLWYGLQRLEYNGNPVFEMLAVRAKSNGLEIEFTQPLQVGDGWNPNDYLIKQWYYQPTEQYGGPKLDESKLTVKSATVSDDRKKVFLEIPDIKEGYVVYVNLLNHFVSENRLSLWTTESWYTMNKIPKGNAGISKPSPYPNTSNTLTPEEIADGWQLLFDGERIEGWHNYGSTDIGSSWVIDGDALALRTETDADGKSYVKDGGDIITDEEYEDFELKLEWKISNCGNSGIIFAAQESEEYDHIWQTGPEMQILDNTCHPDTKYVTHRAGDLYDMIETSYITVNPAGAWNKVRIIKEDGEVEFWLNGYKVVAFTMYDESWKARISDSKFAEWPGFGTHAKGHIALQDHSDPVWFRNIKIRKL